MNKIEYFRKAMLALFLFVTTQATMVAISTVYVFGDSLSDQGNLFFATDHLLGVG